MGTTKVVVGIGIALGAVAFVAGAKLGKIAREKWGAKHDKNNSIETRDLPTVFSIDGNACSGKSKLVEKLVLELVDKNIAQGVYVVGKCGKVYTGGNTNLDNYAGEEIVILDDSDAVNIDPFNAMTDEDIMDLVLAKGIFEKVKYIFIVNQEGIDGFLATKINHLDADTELNDDLIKGAVSCYINANKVEEDDYRYRLCDRTEVEKEEDWFSMDEMIEYIRLLIEEGVG